MSNLIRLGLCGAGVVGSGVLKLLEKNQKIINQQVAPAKLKVVQVGARSNKHNCNFGDAAVVKNVLEVAKNPQVDVLIELIGGTDTALDLVKTALNNGKHVVTANKALLAEHGAEIFDLARSKGLFCLYEASIAGGIPIVKVMREGLVANRINSICAILNGTCNYVLSTIEEQDLSFAEALKAAQVAGYAEADPTLDIEGVDAAHKIALLASIAFDVQIDFSEIQCAGIRNVDHKDVCFAAELGYRIKPLAVARMDEFSRLEVRTYCAMLPINSRLARVSGADNAVCIDSDPLGATMFVGAGAGAGPTASAVMSDVIEIARCAEIPHFAHLPPQEKYKIKTVEQIRSSFYLRLTVQDQKGVMEEISHALTNNNISIKSLIQKPVADCALADVVILTHTCNENLFVQALEDLSHTARTSVKSMVQIRLLDDPEHVF